VVSRIAPPEPVWFFYHVPKTGGQTLRNHLRATMGTDEHLYLGRWTFEEPRPVVDDQLRAGAPSARVVTGHPLRREHASWFPSRPLREVLVLREPVARIVSHYSYRTWALAQQGRPPEDFERFVQVVVQRDPMTRWVARFVGEGRSRRRLDAALHALAGFTAVTDIEALDTVVPHLLGAMGLPPVVPERANRSGQEFDALPELDSDMLDDLRERTREDEILHRAAVRLTDRTIETLDRLAAHLSDQRDA